MHDDSADRLLRQYLAAGSDSEVEIHLTHILDDLAKPIITRIVVAELHGPAAIEEAEDVVSDTVMHLLRRLRDLKDDSSQPIHDLRGYIAACAYNECHEHLRERYPARNRLRNHLQYFLKHHPEFALWRGSDCRLVCGYRDWVGRDTVSTNHIDDLSLAASSDPAAENHAQINRLVSATFAHLGAAVPLDVLVEAIARLINLEQRRVELPLYSSELTDPPAADSRLELRFSLHQLWDDIRQLSPRQRTALLLNLRDAHGREILSLLPQTRTATIAEIAATLQIPITELAKLWRELPLNDVMIGERLAASRQQVIKLRRLARERLRRMATRREQVVDRRQTPSADIPVAKKLGGSAAR
jgi:RNA polymerase sigma factor (sigma-70 family)